MREYIRTRSNIEPRMWIQNVKFCMRLWHRQWPCLPSSLPKIFLIFRPLWLFLFFCFYYVMVLYTRAERGRCRISLWVLTDDLMLEWLSPSSNELIHGLADPWIYSSPTLPLEAMWAVAFIVPFRNPSWSGLNGASVDFLLVALSFLTAAELALLYSGLLNGAFAVLAWLKRSPP
jgi:hypothetical protein